ncbi:MAG: ATP-binding protein [Chloroflexota bacterium]
MMAQKSLTPEILVPRLGEYLVQKGLVSEDELSMALAHQRVKSQAGEQTLLGEILLELKLLDRKSLDNAVTEQIIQLRSALEDSNRHLERRVAERTAELEEALRKLSELNQLKANFVSNISHELRTPLTHIKGYLELLVTETLGTLTDKQEQAVKVSQQSAGRLEGLIEGLILFSLASRGEMSLKLVPVDMTKVAENVLGLSGGKAKDRNVQLRSKIAPNLPLVQVDSEKISWVILHLLDNAMKFTPSGGQVELMIQPETDEMIMVSVVDSGIGIPSDRTDEIFEPFHQLDGSSTRRYGGTGLGLTLVRQILTAHGSTIDVESEEGKGSTFRFPVLVAHPAEVHSRR